MREKVGSRNARGGERQVCARSFLVLLGGFGVPFWAQLDFEGVPKSCVWPPCCKNHKKNILKQDPTKTLKFDRNFVPKLEDLESNNKHFA